jgi:hypothetical protein
MQTDSEEIILDDKRETPLVTDARREPETEIPPAPPPPRTRSGELLAVLRAKSDAPPDPVQARLDAWGEVIFARLEEATTTASTASTAAKRASRENEDQNGAIGQALSSIEEVKTRVTALEEKGDVLQKTAALAVKKLSGLSSPKMSAALGTIATILAGALATYAKSKGWIP